MDVQFSAELEAEITRVAAGAGKAPTALVQEVMADYLEWERHDYDEAVAGIRQGSEEMKAGLGRPAAEFLDDLRRKHDLSR